LVIYQPQEAIMGLLDILSGIQGGSAGGGSQTPGMSPIAIALVGLVAAKALQGSGGQPAAGGGGLLGGLLQGVAGGGAGGLLGGLLGGSNAGSVLSGGLGDLVKQLQDAGHGDAVSSWIGSGENKPIATDDLADALGADKIDALMAHSGMSRGDLLSGLAQQLPAFIDQLTPNGRLPTAAETQAHVG
jgi:uncharacterized protein YidB (DUF937 family)